MPALEDKSDVELLLDYSGGRSHSAFEALVRRHGSLVQGVARRVLSNHHDAEDITQATFLLLAREASKLSKGQCLAGWLHTVARRLSLNALKSRKLREAREYAAMNEDTRIDTPSDGLQADFGRQLDAALSHLPERYRQPLILFHLEGASIEEASRRLNLHTGTFRTRLGRARALLREALVRRGVKVASVGMLAGLLATESKAATLSASGVRTISEAALGKGTLGAGAQALADGLGGVHGLDVSSLSTSIIFIMKTKASILLAVLIAAAAFFASTRLIRQREPVDQTKHEDRRLAKRMSDLSKSQRASTKDIDSVSKISKRRDFDYLRDSVFGIADESQRLQAIRQQLGMNVSDQVYRRALEERRYDLDANIHLITLCGKWAETDGEATIEWAQKFSGEVRDEMTGLVLLLWLAKNEDEALAWGQANLKPERLQQVRNAAEMSGKPWTMPADEVAGFLAAMYANEQLPAEQRSKNLFPDLHDAIYEFGHKNPEATLEFIRSHGGFDSPKFNSAIPSFFKAYAGRDPDAALALASEQLEGDLRLDSMVYVLECWQAKYPYRSMHEVADLEQFSDKQYQGLELAAAAIQARVDPEGALKRAMQAQSPEMKEKTLKAVLEVRAVLAKDEVQQWAFALPEGEFKDISLDLLAQSMAKYDLYAGANLLSQISDSARREMAVGEILLRHHAQDGDLEAAMSLADQSRAIPVDLMDRFEKVVTADEIVEFISWLRERRAQGRIEEDKAWHLDRLITNLEKRRKELK